MREMGVNKEIGRILKGKS